MLLETLIFSRATGVGTGMNRQPGPDEFSITRDRKDCAWFVADSTRYKYADGVFSERPEWQQEQAARVAEAVAAKSRIAAIEQTRETIGVHKLTIEQAESYINNQINGATTAAEKVEAVRNILLKMVPYILK